MLQKLRVPLFTICLVYTLACNAQPGNSAIYQPIPNQPANNKPDPRLSVQTGAERLDKYLPLIKGKGVAIFANQTSIAGSSHLVDTLAKLGVNIKVIFGPEHG